MSFRICLNLKVPKMESELLKLNRRSNKLSKIHDVNRYVTLAEWYAALLGCFAVKLNPNVNSIGDVPHVQSARMAIGALVIAGASTFFQRWSKKEMQGIETLFNDQCRQLVTKDANLYDLDEEYSPLAIEAIEGLE